MTFYRFHDAIGGYLSMCLPTQGALKALHAAFVDRPKEIYPANTQRKYNVVQRCDFATL